MFFLFARVFWLKLTDTIIFKFLVNFLSNISDFLCKDFSNLVCNQNLLHAILESLLFFFVSGPCFLMSLCVWQDICIDMSKLRYPRCNLHLHWKLDCLICTNHYKYSCYTICGLQSYLTINSREILVQIRQCATRIFVVRFSVVC